MIMAALFVNRNGKIRSGWKIALMFSMFIISALLVGFIFKAYSTASRNQVPSYIVEMLQNLCEIGAVILSVKVLERESLRSFGFPRRSGALKNILWGGGFGVGSVIVYTAIFVASGFAKLQQPLSHPRWSPSLLWLLILMILVGFGEEMMTRGYTLTLIRRQTGKTWLAVGVSAIIFAILHSLNSGFSALAATNLILFSLVTAAMYIRSGSLWMPIAYHVGWDYFEGNVFGYPNSGHRLQSLYSVGHVGNNVLTGGRFGPESGLVSTGLLLIALLWTLFAYRAPAEDGQSVASAGT